MLGRWIKQSVHSLIGEPTPSLNVRLCNRTDVCHIGPRAYCAVVNSKGERFVKKVFATTTPGRRAFASERNAYRRFRDYSWMPAWERSGLNWYTRQMYNGECRLDKVAASLSEDERRRVAGRILSVLLDLYVHGVAHRDVHARNLFYVDGDVKLIDYETIGSYPLGTIPPFGESYDITGRGMESPYRTNSMGYCADHAASVERVLGVEFSVAKEELRAIVVEQLRDASLTFRNHAYGRHTCRAQQIYNTISLPGMVVTAGEAQRNCARRFERFGISRGSIAGSRVLDLGSNVGGMLFEAQRFAPSKCLGVEYDRQKVMAARRVAAYCGVDGVRFVEGDIDRLRPRDVDGPHDVVFCLAVDRHVRKRQRLYSLLGRITGNVLYFEGNTGSDVEEISQALMRGGFRRVEHLGMCDDDALAANNCRPILRAWKQ